MSIRQVGFERSRHTSKEKMPELPTSNLLSKEALSRIDKLTLEVPALAYRYLALVLGLHTRLGDRSIAARFDADGPSDSDSLADELLRITELDVDSIDSILRDVGSNPQVRTVVTVGEEMLRLASPGFGYDDGPIWRRDNPHAYELHQRIRDIRRIMNESTDHLDII